MKIISQHRGGKSSGLTSSRVKHPRAASAVAGKSKSVAKAAVKARHGNGNGNGHGNGPGTAPRDRTRSGQAQAAEPHYDAGLSYDSGVRYTVDPVPPPPLPGGAKVRLELSRRTNPDLAAFAEAHVIAMAGNVNFPTPTPSVAVFGQKLAAFEAMLSQMENLRLESTNLTAQSLVLRAELQALFGQRGTYVEVASNGNADIIITSGLPVRRGPTPVGQLPWPMGLVVEQTQVIGQLQIRWKPVASAKGYIVQCAEVVAGQPRVWVNAYAGGKLTSLAKELTPGKMYEFQAAAIGGSTGQSDFSPVVGRMAS